MKLSSMKEYVMNENILGTDDFNCLTRMRDGWMLYNKYDHYIGQSIELYGEFSNNELRLFKDIVKPSSTVIEVGANIGSHTVGLSKHLGPRGLIYAYEPQRIVYQTLCANIALNSCTNVYCYEKAASNQYETIKIPNIRYDVEGNFGAVEIQQFSEGADVEVVILDQHLAQLNQCQLLKVDAEGMEYQVLDGAKDLIDTHKPILYVENDRVMKSQALIELIMSMGYKLFWHITPMYSVNNFKQNTENIFPKISSFNMLCIHESIPMNLTGFIEIIDSTQHPLAK